MSTEFQTVAGHLEKLERLFATVTRKNCAECGNEFDALGIVIVCPACEMLPAKRDSEALPLPPCWPRRHVSRLGEMVGPSLAMAEKLAPKIVGGRLCVLAGQRGTGKTQIAAFAADWRARNGYGPGIYTRGFDLCASVVGFDREAKLERLQKTPFLVIDELHRMETKDLPLIESVVDDRYSNDRATLCIGNWISLDGLHLGETVDGEKLTGLGSSLFSRIQEHQRDRTGGVVWCKWESYRTATKEGGAWMKTRKADTPAVGSLACPETGGEHGRARNEEYDAYYCPKCGMWLEPRCGDPECEMCGDRPPKSPNDADQATASARRC